MAAQTKSATETIEQKIARLERENAELRERKNTNGKLSCKLSSKGGLSVYGLGRFPVTLYKEQWTRLLDYQGDIREFLKAHDGELKAKGE